MYAPATSNYCQSALFILFLVHSHNCTIASVVPKMALHPHSNPRHLTPFRATAPILAFVQTNLAHRIFFTTAPYYSYIGISL